MKTRSGHPPSQRDDEIYPFIDFLNLRNVRSYLEVGARHGDTFFEVMMALPAGSRGVAVDLPDAAWGRDGSQIALMGAVDELRLRGYVVRVILGDSQDAAIIKMVADAGPYDAALIDGDHRLAGVTADWENYGEMADLVAFHDVAGEGIRQKRTKLPIEVPILWSKLKRSHRYAEFIGAERGMGIGVIIQ